MGLELLCLWDYSFSCCFVGLTTVLAVALLVGLDQQPLLCYWEYNSSRYFVGKTRAVAVSLLVGMEHYPMLCNTSSCSAGGTRTLAVVLLCW